jgi:ABC-2 type transport system permease protein
MNTNRIKAMLLQEYYITKRSVETIFDIVVIPIITIIVFGFLSLYLTGTGNNNVANEVIMGMLLWQTLFIAQYSVTVPTLWNIWSRNLSNLFVSPLEVKEFIFSHALTGSLKALLIMTISSIMCASLFGFNILTMGIFPLTLILINVLLFGIVLGTLLLGLIFRFGTKIQALAWGFLSILQPLSAALYPVEIIPQPFRMIAQTLPPTYIFEASRGTLNNAQNVYQNITTSFVLNILFFFIATLLFNKLFNRSKDTGQFARNES